MQQTKQYWKFDIVRVPFTNFINLSARMNHVKSTSHLKEEGRIGKE